MAVYHFEKNFHFISIQQTDNYHRMAGFMQAQPQYQVMPRQLQQFTSPIQTIPALQPTRMVGPLFDSSLNLQPNVAVLDVHERRQPVPTTSQYASQVQQAPSNPQSTEDTAWMQNMSAEQLLMASRLLEMMGKQSPKKQRND